MFQIVDHLGRALGLSCYRSYRAAAAAALALGMIDGEIYSVERAEVWL